MKRNTKIALLACLVALNLAFIWGNSLMDGQTSSELSGGLLAWLKSFLEGLNIQEFVLRKLAHFSEFALLGFLSAELFRTVGERGAHRVASPLLLGLLAACADETIQRFVDGRGSSLVDVWIDTAGALAGICLLYALYGVIIYCKEKRI